MTTEKVHQLDGDYRGFSRIEGDYVFIWIEQVRSSFLGFKRYKRVSDVKLYQLSNTYNERKGCDLEWWYWGKFHRLRINIVNIKNFNLKSSVLLQFDRYMTQRMREQEWTNSIKEIVNAD